MLRLKIPLAVKHTVWLRRCGRVFETACKCCRTKIITPFDFHLAHIQAVSEGGGNTLHNLTCTCAGCNLSMGARSLPDFQKLCGFHKLRRGAQK